MAVRRRSMAGSSSSLSSPPPSSASDSELSELSATPSPPSSPTFAARPFTFNSPSPSSSQRSSAKASPAPANMRPTPPTSDNDGPARKRRKLCEPKERTTEHLDLTQDDIQSDAQLRRVLDVLQTKRKIVVIAGAGISVSAGIPDFRSSAGLFSSLRKEHKLKSSGKDLFDASVYRDDDSTSSFHDMVRSLSKKTKGAQPTAFHHLLATLAQEGRLLRLYTQNVDGIDTSLPPLKTQVPLPKKGPWPKTVQLHGGLDHMVCSKCHTLSEFDAEQFNGPVPPACPECIKLDEVRQVAEKRSHGIGRLRPRMVLYNEHNPDDEAIGSCCALDLRTRPDAVIVVGTTLKVPGVRRIAREMCAVVRGRRDGVAIWMNNDPVPVGKDLENSWDIVVKGPCDEIARHAAMLRWDDPIMYKEVTDDELNKTRDRKPMVMVPMSTPKKMSALAQIQMPTPAASPRLNPQHKATQDPPTPSKTNGRKRKAGAPAVTASKPKAPAKRQPRKSTGTKGKAKSGNQQMMTSVFTVSKSTTAKTAAAAKKEINPVQIAPKKEHLEIFEPTNTDMDESVDLLPTLDPATPAKPKVTKWKTGLAMADIPALHSRFNLSPEMEPFTSPPGTPMRIPHTSRIAIEPEQKQMGASRPSTSSSWRHDTIVPPGAIPHNFGSLIDT